MTLSLRVGEQRIEFVASDVPNNPIQELADALDLAVRGIHAQVWWHLEPYGYFMRFEPVGDEVFFQLDFALCSKRKSATPVLTFRGTRAEVLLPFWRFLREFQSHAYTEPHWPSVRYENLPAIKAKLEDLPLMSCFEKTRNSTR
jgi:hypothetical protein